MSTSVLTQPTRSNNYTDVRRHLSISLAHSQTAISSSNQSVVQSGPISTPTLRRTRPECTKLQLYDRYSQQMLVLACMFVGCVLVRNGAENNQLTGPPLQCRDLGVGDQWIQRSTSDANPSHGCYYHVLVHTRGSLPVINASPLTRAARMGPSPSLSDHQTPPDGSTRYT